VEAAFARRFRARHAIAVNSATTGLHAALAAAGVGPGDEVIVPPTTMTATATAAILCGATPVFADVDPVTVCLDPDAVRRRISPSTRAIVAVDLFGQTADFDVLAAVAREAGATLVEDAAQSIGAADRGRSAGTLADMGVLSFNRHKHITSGEGGMVLTDDDRLAERVRLVRNHAEAVSAGMGGAHDDLVGSNYRMGEIEAALVETQLTRLDDDLASRRRIATRLSDGLARVPGIGAPRPAAGTEHAWYLYPLRIDEGLLGIDRATFAAALRAEGVPCGEGYVAPLYRLPYYRRLARLGRAHPSQLDGSCPVAERLHERTLLTLDICRLRIGDEDVDDAVRAIRKIVAARADLAAGAAPTGVAA
jgi:dTDP-4-amino-4,6-dideoxygalactose transaminase